MYKFLVAGAAVLAIAAGSVALAQAQQQPSAPARPAAWTAADVDAFSDARIAGLKAGLKLNADQEKNWPPVEASIRDMAKQRTMRMNQVRAAAATADPADASEPLYKSLDDAQKRRLLALLVGGRRR
jgi:zinc resistance-associated protein